jgi:hypothetical protein
MSKLMFDTAIEFPEITADDAHRFARAVRIDDEVAFVAELNALVREKLAAALPSGAAQVSESLRAKANALRAKSSWRPSRTDIQRGRSTLLLSFEAPQNVPLAEFARLAHKSRQQIYKDLAAQPRRLLSLDVGRRGQRLPDWQLDPLKLKLTREVLKRAAAVDSWALYHALSAPADQLGGRSPVEVVTPSNFDRLVGMVLSAVSVHDEEAV